MSLRAHRVSVDLDRLQRRLIAWLVWAATTKDKDYIRMQGMKYFVNNMQYRKEFVTGNLSKFMTKGTAHLSACSVLTPTRIQGSLGASRP